VIIVLALLSPFPGFDLITPKTSAVFVFGLVGTVTEIINSTALSTVETVHYLSNETTFIRNETIITTNVTTSYSILKNITASGEIGKGFVTLNGIGDLSAGNPLEMQVTIFFSNLVVPSSVVKFVPEGAFAAQDSIFSLQPAWKTDAQGFPINANITLTPARPKCIRFDRTCVHLGGSVEWTGQQSVIYNQGGAMRAQVMVGGLKGNITEPIQIGSGDITVTARTNSLLIVLTIALIGIGVLEFRRIPSESRSENKKGLVAQ